MHRFVYHPPVHFDDESNISHVSSVNQPLKEAPLAAGSPFIYIMLVTSMADMRLWFLFLESHGTGTEGLCSRQRLHQHSPIASLHPSTFEKIEKLQKLFSLEKRGTKVQEKSIWFYEV